MAEQGINVGGIYADLDIRTGNLDKGLAKGRQAMEAIDKEVKQLRDDFASGAIALGDFMTRTAALSKTQMELASRMHAAYGATRTLNTGLELVTKNSNQMVHSTNRMGQGLMQLGYIADDIQYGFSGVVNNIAPLVGGLTGNAGLATAAQVVAVGAYQLYTNWDRLMDAFGVGIPSAALEGLEAITAELKRVQDELEETGKKARLTLPDQIAIENGKKKVKALTGVSDEEKALKAGEGPTKEERERGSAFAEAIKSQGGSKLVQEALLGEHNARADESGTNLGGDQISKMLRDAGFDPANLQGSDVGTIGSLFGMNLDGQSMQANADAGGPSIGDQIVSALKSQKFIADDATGKMVTPGQLARSQIARGMAGDKVSANEIGDILDKSLANADGLSTFSREFGENSPEGKKSAKDIEENMKKRAKAEKEALADRKRELGPLKFLEEQAAKRELTPGEQSELREGLQAESDKLNREEQQAADKKARETLQAGMAAAPGDIKATADMAVMQQAAGMIAPGAAFGRIRDAIKANGATDEQAIAAANEIRSDATKDMEKGITDRLLNPTAQEQRKQSQVFDATSLAAQFQSSVGGDETKKQTTLLEKLEKHVDMLAKAGKLVKIK